MSEVVDIYAPAAPGSLMRSIKIDKPGIFRLSRRPAELYSVQIVCCGAWGRASVMDDDGRVLWHQPSTFTGSFWLSAGTLKGLRAGIWCLHETDAPSFTINWRERDMAMV